MCDEPTTGTAVLLALFDHHSSEARSRREPEFTYTAASVGGLGAIAWGVVVLMTITTELKSKGIWLATLATTIGIASLVWTVRRKILHDHAAYVNVRKAQQNVVRELLPKGQDSLLPDGFMSQDPGSGHRGSIAIVFAAAVPAIGFCITMLVRSWPW